MERLISESKLMNDPLFETMLEFGSTLAGSKELYQLKNSFKKPLLQSSTKLGFADSNKKGHNLFLTAPLGRYRFTHYDRIYPERKILILTEGKTDAQIIEHAYTMLTEEIPYWNIQPVHESEGGAATLAKCLDNGAPFLEENTIVLGIFDNDSSGIQHFNGMLKKFELVDGSKRIKKHKERNVFALKLPIPPFRENYRKDDQSFNFFSIEHYFSDDLLNSQNMLEPTELPNIFKIRDKGSAKVEFSKYIRSLIDREVFQNFLSLFKEIDNILGVNDVEYFS